MYQGTSIRDVIGTYSSRQSRGLGIGLIVAGVLAMVFVGVAYHYADIRAVEIGHGFWCGALLIVTGVFGIVAAQVRTRWSIVTFLVLQLVSACLSIAMTGIAISALVFYGPLLSVCFNFCELVIVPLAMESVLTLLGVGATIITFRGAYICYRAIRSSTTASGVA